MCMACTGQQGHRPQQEYPNKKENNKESNKENNEEKKENNGQQALQQRMKASGVTARVVDASFWSSDRAVCQLPSSVPLVLIGDALAGKPFYTGSTLNRHLWDVAKLVEEVEFAYDGGPLELSRFGSYERRYQDCVRRIGEFQRRAAAPVLPKSDPQSKSGFEMDPELGEAITSDDLAHNVETSGRGLTEPHEVLDPPCIGTRSCSALTVSSMVNRLA
ncbi:unnamed protein product [Cladocopium goreaui]|uniref:Peptidase C1-like protein n=1 Tax=Cladocopium goreaui TaxID=2562237 RepID=A0A9P1DII2_9DINO|nr:unnamed protein product [Cladocopium goreaui]